MQNSHRISRRNNSHQTTMVIVTITNTTHPSTPSSNHRYNRHNKNETKRGAWNFIELNGNERFTQAKGGIARLFYKYKLHDPFNHLHGTQCEIKSHIRGTHRIDFYLCTNNSLKVVKLCGMTGFNDIITSDYCGLYLELQAEAIANPQNQSTTSPFERKLN